MHIFTFVQSIICRTYKMQITTNNIVSYESFEPNKVWYDNVPLNIHLNKFLPDPCSFCRLVIRVEHFVSPIHIFILFFVILNYVTYTFKHFSLLSYSTKHIILSHACIIPLKHYFLRYCILQSFYGRMNRIKIIKWIELVRDKLFVSRLIFI